MRLLSGIYVWNFHRTTAPPLICIIKVITHHKGLFFMQRKIDFNANVESDKLKRPSCLMRIKESHILKMVRGPLFWWKRALLFLYICAFANCICLIRTYIHLFYVHKYASYMRNVLAVFNIANTNFGEIITFENACVLCAYIGRGCISGVGADYKLLTAEQHKIKCHFYWAA